MLVDARGFVPSKPPAISTRPSSSAAAAWSVRAPLEAPSTTVKSPVSGSKTSSESIATPLSSPPAMSTLPSGSRVAVCPRRATFNEPADSHTFAAES